MAKSDFAKVRELEARLRTLQTFVSGVFQHCENHDPAFRANVKKWSDALMLAIFQVQVDAPPGTHPSVLEETTDGARYLKALLDTWLKLRTDGAAAAPVADVPKPSPKVEPPAPASASAAVLPFPGKPA